MFGITGAEVALMLVMGSLSLVPLAVCAWAIITLRALRAGQEAVLGRLDAIERALQRSSAGSFPTGG